MIRRWVESGGCDTVFERLNDWSDRHQVAIAVVAVLLVALTLAMVMR